MVKLIFEHLEQALMEYGQGENFLSLLKAKAEYFQLTGTVNEDDEEYESRMNCFNDWYLFQFILPNKNCTVIEDYLRNKALDAEYLQALKSVNYSLFEFTKKNFKGQIVLEDLLHEQKIILPSGHENLGMVPKDFFTGRIMTFNGENFLLRGTCIFPMEVKSICRKQAKKVRKLQSQEGEVSFLLTLESLKTKWNRYGHIAVNKIFTFPA